MVGEAILWGDGREGYGDSSYVGEEFEGASDGIDAKSKELWSIEAEGGGGLVSHGGKGGEEVGGEGGGISFMDAAGEQIEAFLGGARQGGLAWSISRGDGEYWFAILFKYFVDAKSSFSGS